MIAIKHKREFELDILPRVIAFNAHGESRALSLQAFTTQVRFFHHFIIFYHYLFIMTKHLVVKASKHSPYRSVLIHMLLQSPIGARLHSPAPSSANNIGPLPPRLGSPRESCRSSFKSLLLQPRSLKRPSARQTGVSSYSTPAESIPMTSRGSTSKQGVLSAVRSSSQTAPTLPNMPANQVNSTTTPSTLLDQQRQKSSSPSKESP